MDATLWAPMFDLHLPVLEKVLRPILVYAFLSERLIRGMTASVLK